MAFLSVVTTLYNSESYVFSFYERVLSTLKQLNIQKYQIVFVNDGSPDNSADVVRRICSNDSRVTFVDLSRNFGHHNALMAGLHYARGSLVWLLDSDLEEQPEWLPLFYHKLSSHVDADVVYGIQTDRKGAYFERISGNVFYSIINYLLPLEFPRNLLTARLMTMRYVRALLQYQESSFVIGGLWFWLDLFKYLSQL